MTLSAPATILTAAVTILAVLILHELPVVWQLVGGIIVLIGIYVAKRGSVDRAKS